MSDGPILLLVSVYDRDECKAVPASGIITLFPEASTWLQNLVQARMRV